MAKINASHHAVTSYSIQQHLASAARLALTPIV